MPRHCSRFSVFVLALGFGCSGELVGGLVPGATPGTPDPVSPDPTMTPMPMRPTPGPDLSFPCEAGQTSVAPLRRLSAVQYRNTVRDLFAPAPGLDVATVASMGLARLPVDEVSLSFSGIDSRISESHVQAWYDVADSLAGAVVATPAVLSTLAGTCASQAPSAACINGFLDGFARRAFRRPLTTEERTRYLALNDGSRDARELFRSLFFSVLMAPGFLYQPEVNGQLVSGSTSTLTIDPFELASRLSFHFWQSMPDQALLTAAANGTLTTDNGYREQLERVVADPRTRTTMGRFYDEWFQVGHVARFPSTQVFTAFAAGTTIGQAGADHLQAADDELQALTSHFTWDTQGTIKDVLLTDLSFTRSTHLASLYGVPAWDGTSPHPRLDASQRSGLLTRAAFLMSGTHSTHPIHRGAVVRRRLLCQDLPSPSPAALPPDALIPPMYQPDQTTRRRFENKVLQEPCASCHLQMNPIGYVLENYDALGRFRTEERIFDEATGALVNTLPIDSTAQPRIDQVDESPLSTAQALSEQVANSGLVEACFARQYFRFTHRRTETPADGCTLERLRTSGSGSLKAGLIDVALNPSFRTRKVE
ncbi:MAG: DUF1592 domain-containing protein [Myxococcales bacterium]|nr:DUF1592 domain-containing protein [Myxococcales bacterium]MDP3504922.1 DUF1592 domain-containing protein [Myxococcales bacterium]